MLAISLTGLLHLSAIKVGWTVVNLLGVYYVNRNLHEAKRNLLYLEAGGWNGYLRIEAKAAIVSEQLRLVAVWVGALIGVVSFFVLDRPGPDLASQLFTVMASIGLILISATAVLNSYLNLKKVDAMLKLHGVDTKATPVDYTKE